MTQEADNGKKRCAGSKSKKDVKGGGKKIEDGVGDRIDEGLPKGSMEGLMKGWVRKDWVEELIVGLVRESAGRKALKLLRASVTVR